MVERGKDRVVVENQSTDLKEVFYEDLKMPKTLAFTKQDEESLKKLLKELSTSEANTSEAGVRMVVGSHHFPLRKSLFTAFVLSVSLTGSIMATLAAPTAGAIALTGTALAVIERWNSLITKLDATELVVYNELATLTKDGPKGNAYTAADVENQFLNRGETPPDVEGTLSLLREHQVVKSRASSHGIEHWIEW